MRLFDKFKKHKKNKENICEVIPIDNCALETYDDVYEKEDKTGKHAIFLCIADTHGDLLHNPSYLEEEIKNKHIDAVLCLGDIRKDELRIIQKTCYKIPIYGIKGNHDDDNQFEDTNIVDINGIPVDINGIVITGMEGSIKYKPTAIGFSQEESLEFAKTLPPADILITHCHCYRQEDEFYAKTNCHIGLKGSRWYMNTHDCINIHGHDHKGTIIINKREIRVYGIQTIEYKEGEISFI